MEDNRRALILIVDDMPVNIKVLGRIVSKCGYDYITASNGMATIEQAESLSPDAILLDIMMPKPDGYEVCRRLKSNGHTKDIPVIFITGKTQPRDIVKGFRMGAVDYITKPFNSAELAARLHTHVELKRSRDKIERMLDHLMVEMSERMKMEVEREGLIIELQEAIAKIKTLDGLIPICAWCKKVRDDKGYWKRVEVYVKERSNADFTHGICPDCLKKDNPELYEKYLREFGEHEGHTHPDS